MAVPVAAAPAAPSPAPSSAPASGGGAPAKSSAQPVKPNPVGGGSRNQQEPAGTGAPAPQPTTPQRHKWTAKIDGKEQEFEASDDDLRGAYLQRRGAEQRFQESARLKKEAAEERARAEQTMAQFADPTGEKMLEVFMRTHPDADPIEVLATILQKKMHENEELQDPNIRERRRLERENAEYRTKDEQAESARVEAEQAKEVDFHVQKIAKTFKDALQLTKLPVNDITVEMMAKVEKERRSQGWELTPEQLARSTEKAIGSLVEGMLTDETTTDEQLLAAFPKLTQRVHKAIVARFKAKQAGGQQRPSDITPRERRPSAEAPQPGKQRVVSSAEEHKLYGGKGLRSL